MSLGPHGIRVFSVLLLALLPAGTRTADALVLDWDSVAWTEGTLNNSFDVDPATAGNDMTVTISGDTAQLQPELISPYPQTPVITTNFGGGLTPVQSTLSLAVNFTNQSQSVTVTVDFSALYALGVQNVSFTIFDVDFANAGASTYEDRLSSITALSIDGTTLLAPTITTSANNTVTGAGFSQVVVGTASTVDTGPGSGAANVTINFGTSAIRSFTFTYGGSGAFADPTYQHIGIHDINFTPVPEMDPAIAASLSCFLALGLTRLAQRRARLRQASR